MEIIKFHYILFRANKECKQHLEYTQKRLDSTFNVHNSNQLIYTLLICLLNNGKKIQIEHKQTVYCI